MLNYAAILVGLFWCLLGADIAAAPKGNTYSESQIKVALVYKLMHFIKWPAETPLSLCVYKPSTEDVESFNLIPSQMESGNPITVSIFNEKGKSLKQKHCNIIYFSRDSESNIQYILKDVAVDKSLTIGETGQFIKQGGMINLIRKDLTIKFEINVSALEKSDLTISSQVLRIAEQIYTEEDL